MLPNQPRFPHFYKATIEFFAITYVDCTAICITSRRISFLHHPTSGTQSFPAQPCALPPVVVSSGDAIPTPAKEPPLLNAVHAPLTRFHCIVVFHALVVKSISPGRSPPSEAFSQVQLPTSRLYQCPLLCYLQSSVAYRQLAFRKRRNLPSLSGSQRWLGHRCTRQRVELLRQKSVYLLSDVEGECELTAGASWTSTSIFSSLLIACTVHRRLLAARTGRLLSADAVVALAAAGAWLDHVWRILRFVRNLIM